MIPYGRRAVDKAFSSASHLIATFLCTFTQASLAQYIKKASALGKRFIRVSLAGQSSNFLEDLLTLNATEPPLSNNNF